MRHEHAFVDEDNMQWIKSCLASSYKPVSAESLLLVVPLFTYDLGS